MLENMVDEQKKRIAREKEARLESIDKTTTPAEQEARKDIIVHEESQSYENFVKAVKQALEDLEKAKHQGF